MKASNSIQSVSDNARCTGTSLTALVILLCFQLSLWADEHAYEHAASSTTLAKVLHPPASADVVPAKLPRLPKGVAELKFGEFFIRPVGPRGLEVTETLRQLDGQLVRILGYMAQEESPVPGRFLLAPIPVQIHSHDNSLADDLPPAVVYVVVPTLRGQRIPYSPQLMLLTGQLSVGNRDEADGRISIARLALDPPGKVVRKTSAPSVKGASALIKRDVAVR